jgi:hypothetical protein
MAKPKFVNTLKILIVATDRSDGVGHSRCQIRTAKLEFGTATNVYGFI